MTSLSKKIIDEFENIFKSVEEMSGVGVLNHPHNLFGKTCRIKTCNGSYTVNMNMVGGLAVEYTDLKGDTYGVTIEKKK